MPLNEKVNIGIDLDLPLEIVYAYYMYELFHILNKSKVEEWIGLVYGLCSFVGPMFISYACGIPITKHPVTQPPSNLNTRFGVIEYITGYIILIISIIVGYILKKNM